jgi:hypothetical protein
MTMTNYPTVPQLPTSPAVKPFRGMAIAGFVVALVGCVFGLIPILFVFAWVAGVAALVFSGLGYRWTLGKWGIVLAVVAIVLGIIGAVIVNSATTKLQNDLNNINTNATHAAACIDGSTVGADGLLVWPPGCEDVATP